MSHTKNTSPFRCFHGDSSNNDLYSTNGIDQSIETYNIGNIPGTNSGAYIGFRFRSYANDRGMWAHCSQSWTTSVLLAALTCVDVGASTTVRTDKTLMSSLKGGGGGAFNFGDDAVFFFKSGGTTTYSGVKLYAAYSNNYPRDPSNTESNFGALIFTDAT
jgi:hypothetical protein